VALSKIRTLTVSMLVAKNIELFTHALSGITIIILILDKCPKYQTVRLNTGHHQATLNMKYINRPPLLDDLDLPLMVKRIKCLADLVANYGKKKPIFLRVERY